MQKLAREQLQHSMHLGLHERAAKAVILLDRLKPGVYTCSLQNSQWLCPVADGKYDDASQHPLLCREQQPKQAMMQLGLSDCACTAVDLF